MKNDFASSEVRPSRAPTAILGVPFDPVTQSQALARIEQMIASRQPHYLATANVDFVVQAQSDRELRRILSDAHLVLCDGTPLVWASRWLGNPLPERVAGADLVPALIQVAAAKNYKIFLLGATPEAASQAVEKLKVQYPNLQISSYSPPFKPLLQMDHAEISRRVREAKPDLLLVSFGCPKQEKWIAMHYRELGVPVAIGVGATIDFLAGAMKRAPLWMQRTGTEWMFRLAQEPRRLFKRYAMDLGVFGFKFLWQLWRFQSRGGKPGGEKSCAATLRTNGWQHLGLPERFDRAAVENSAPLFERVLDDDTRHCLLEMRDVRFLDSTGAACLMRLRREFSARGRQMILLSPGKAVRAALKFMRVQDFFLIADDIHAAHRLNHAWIKERAQPVLTTNPLLWQGEITVANAEQVWQATERRLAARAHDELTIDLSRVRHLDSSGAELMARLRTVAGQLNSRFSFVNASPAVRNVLRHARLETLLVIPPPLKPIPATARTQLALSQPT
ncbi:MAG: WecB/TagA/CpsF family glycosyltransferase [Akkermansiaceae bacterium]|nr:WecB/TagA/CpsF family glycosyltransferase [Verrucomicrobiales bacterium]